MKNARENIWQNTDGATAVETALVLPFVTVFLFGILQIALVFFDISMTSNSLEDASREILMISGPTDQDVIDAANTAIHVPNSGNVNLVTTFSTKYGSDYADLTATYTYSFEIPFYPDNIDFSINRELSTEIVLQR